MNGVIPSLGIERPPDARNQIKAEARTDHREYTATQRRPVDGDEGERDPYECPHEKQDQITGDWGKHIKGACAGKSDPCAKLRARDEPYFEHSEIRADA